jgi:hypothetical protein
MGSEATPPVSARSRSASARPARPDEAASPACSDRETGHLGCPPTRARGHGPASARMSDPSAIHIPVAHTEASDPLRPELDSTVAPSPRGGVRLPCRATPASPTWAGLPRVDKKSAHVPALGGIRGRCAGRGTELSARGRFQDATHAGGAEPACLARPSGVMAGAREAGRSSTPPTARLARSRKPWKERGGQGARPAGCSRAWGLCLPRAPPESYETRDRSRRAEPGGSGAMRGAKALSGFRVHRRPS